MTDTCLSFGLNIQTQVHAVCPFGQIFTQVHAVCPLGQIFRHRFTWSVIMAKQLDKGSHVYPYGETDKVSRNRSFLVKHKGSRNLSLW